MLGGHQLSQRDTTLATSPWVIAQETLKKRPDDRYLYFSISRLGKFFDFEKEDRNKKTFLSNLQKNTAGSAQGRKNAAPLRLPDNSGSILWSIWNVLCG